MNRVREPSRNLFTRRQWLTISTMDYAYSLNVQKTIFKWCFLLCRKTFSRRSLIADWMLNMSTSDTKRERVNNETIFNERATEPVKRVCFECRGRFVRGRVSLIDDTYINSTASLYVQDWFASPPHFYRTNSAQSIIMLVRRRSLSRSDSFNSHWHRPTIHCRPPPRRDQHNSSLSFTIQTCSEIFSSIFSTNISHTQPNVHTTQLRGAGYWLIVMARSLVRWFSLLICFIIL